MGLLVINEAVYRTAPATPGLLNRLGYIILGDFKSRRASKSHYWFKSNSDFAELVDFAYWWSFSGEGSASAACALGLFHKKISTKKRLTNMININPEMCIHLVPKIKISKS